MVVKRTEKISVTFTPQEKDMIEQLAEKRNMTQAAFCRYCVLNYIDAVKRYKSKK